MREVEKGGKNMSQKAYLDVSVSICPHCGAFYADASWYAVVLESDVECGVCGNTFNPKKSLKDRILLEFELDESGKVVAVKKTKDLK